MRNHIYIILILAIFGGCEQNSNMVAPVPSAPLSTSNVKDSILYTFEVPKNNLGIFDSLTMTLTAFNEASTPETLIVGQNSRFYTWSLKNDSGKEIITGPWIGNNLLSLVILNPHQSEVLYGLRYSMADIFKAQIIAGTYLLQWNLSNGLSFQLNLSCRKSESEINDPDGVISPIYPLKVGNRWTFKESYVFNDTVLVGAAVTQSIIGEKMINGEKWFLLISSDVDQLITARADGIYVYYPDLKVAVLRYKYPTTIGEEYTSGYDEWTGAMLTLVNFQMTVDSTNEVVSVPRGQYQCYKYHAPEVTATFGNQTNEIGSEVMFLSNVGPVKKIDGNSFLELTSTNF